MEPQEKTIEQIQAEYDQIIAFLEYEEAFTVDPRTQERIRRKLEQLNIWPLLNKQNLKDV